MPFSVKHTFILLIVTIISSSIIFGLWAISKSTNIEKNGFTRFIQFTPNVVKTLELKSIGYYFCGTSSSNIYLHSNATPLEIVSLETKNWGIQYKVLKGLDSLKLFWNAARAYVDSPLVYISEGITPKLTLGRIENGQMTIKNDSLPRFLSIELLNDSQFVVKSFNKGLKRTALRKYSTHAKNTYVKEYLIESQFDGMFCSDGTLKYDQDSKRIYYIFRYRNEFICLDQNLDFLYKSNTIDTNFYAKVKVQEVKEGEFVLAAPPKQVNKASYVVNNKLFVLSQLRADNDNYMTLDTRAAIDIYSLENGHYLSSFYIPYIQGESKLTSFAVDNNLFYAIYGNNLVISKIVDKLH